MDLINRCDRCKGDMSFHRVSWFNTDEICGDCQRIEDAHPGLAAAKEKEREECMRGNFNYEGVGLPLDLKTK
jgi:hypothetical protein